VRIVETPIFTKRITEVLTDEEYSRLQWALIINPETGEVIPGAGGLRKVRWALHGKGKRGGLRIIYYAYKEDGTIYMIYPYKKSGQEDLTKEQMKRLILYVKGSVL